MGHQHRSTSRTTWLSWDNYLIGVAGLGVAAALGTVAATVALSGHHTAAIAVAALALGFALPALVQLVGELLGILLLLGTLVVFVVAAPALLCSARLRARAVRHWSNLWGLP
ncbi:hypothetical protein [Nocardia bovistercoris]|uniref:Uncharacterized protein n=1 Tax=Nocardia bovistercoris TaxID=2785916 RepID=A0A931I7X8_9NOCA|nr:hypothetical protein [Nocardia bovistercoris]MBH0775931.1 hypothetical protein [Nocardia bovistercoris]